MKIKKKILIAFIFIAIIFIFKNTSYAGTQRLNSLDYNATLNEDGSMDVVETWDIYISETNTLFKDFDLDSSKYSGITNVKVKNLSTGEILTQIEEEMYHVTMDCYYGLKIDYDTFEIAWGVGLDNSSDTRKYQISYTVQDAVTVYNDCSELYWMFLSTDNSIPVNKVTAVIKLPKAVSELAKLRVWAHGPLNGEIQKESRDTVIFSVDELSAKTMLEVRIVSEEAIFPLSNKIVYQNKLDNILEEEQKWADEANRTRMVAKIIVFVIALVYILILIFFAKKIKKYIKEYKNIEEMKLVDNVGKYFRDVPNQKLASPAQAAYLFYSKKNSFGIANEYSKIFSATLLQLCLKKCISFDKIEKDFVINFLKDKSDIDGLNLTETEKNIFKFLFKMSDDSSIKMSEIKDYAKKNYDEFDSEIKKLEEEAKKENLKLQNFNIENEKLSQKYVSKATIYIVSMTSIVIFVIPALPLLPFLLPIFAEWLICILILKKTSKKIHVLTEKGEIERLEWKGLRNYMKDFSLLKERDVPELALWEEYLVYATAFGIAEEVIKQLKVVYPEISNLDNSSYYYMPYVMDSSFKNGFLNELNRGIDSAYNTYKTAYNSAHSSGSGGGGGFSSGGGGRRRRRPEWAEDKMKKLASSILIEQASFC